MQPLSRGKRKFYICKHKVISSGQLPTYIAIFICKKKLPPCLDCILMLYFYSLLFVIKVYISITNQITKKLNCISYMYFKILQIYNKM